MKHRPPSTHMSASGTVINRASAAAVLLEKGMWAGRMTAGTTVPRVLLHTFDSMSETRTLNGSNAIAGALVEPLTIELASFGESGWRLSWS